MIKQILGSTYLSIQTTSLEMIVQDIKENNPFGMNRLMDFFCSMDSIRDQYFQFTTIMQPVISVLEENLSTEEGIDRDILLKLLEILEHFIFRYNFNIQVSSYDTTSSLYAKPYTIYEIKLLLIYQDILEVFISLLNILKSADVLITQNMIIILQRLWNLFPEYQSALYNLIYTNLKDVAAGGTEEAKLIGAAFLTKIMKNKDTSPDFKGKLENEEILSSLFQAGLVDDEIFELGEPTGIDNLQIIVGFPLCAVISSGSEWNHLVEVPESMCILSWGFATEQYDLSFTLQRVDLPISEVIIPKQKVRCDECPASGIRLLNSSGLYKFTWSNSHSWFRAKHLRYKIFLLRPYKTGKANPSQSLGHVISILNETIESPNANFLEVGVQMTDKILRLSSLDPSSVDRPNYILEEVSYNSIPEITLCISDFIEELIKTSQVAISSIKIGLVQKEVKEIPGVAELGCIALAKDVHAVALLSQDNLHSHTLIAVMYEDGLRSCVIHRGKILLSEDGQSLGDLSIMKDIEIAQGIGILLCMFGPADVILTGDEFIENLNSLIINIRAYVPPQIWKSSTIRESIYKSAASVQAAAMLHYLHYKYKFAM